MKIDSEIKKKALKWVQDVNTEFDGLSSRLRRKWFDWWTMYRTFENVQALPGQSNLFIPKIYEVIEKKVPGIISNEPSFIVNARVNDANRYVAVVRDLLDYWWDRDKMQQKLEPWVKDALIFGVGLAKCDWKQEYGDKKVKEVQYDEITDEEITTETTESQVIFEYPTLQLRSIFDIKVDPRVSNFQEGVGVIDWINDVRYSDLMAMGDKYDLSEIKSLDPEQLADDGFASPEAQEQEQDEGITHDAEEIDKNKITLCEFWGRFCPHDKPTDEKEYIITAIVVDKQPKYIIGYEENKLGLRPFVKIDNRIIRGEFYSISETEPLESLQIEYNNLRNARIDFNNAINYPEWMFNINSGINPVNLIHKPNNIIPVDLPLGTDINSVLRPLDKPQPPVSGINEEVQMNRDFQTISQTIDFTDRGGSQGFTNTATGVRSRDIQTSKQEATIARHLEAAISEVGRIWLALAEMFSEDNIQISRARTEEDLLQPNAPTLSEVPNKFTDISKEILTAALKNYEIEVEAGSTTFGTAEGKAADAVNIANTAVQFASLGVPVDLVRIFTDILRDSFQKSNPEEYIKQPEAPQPGMEQGMPQAPQTPGMGRKVPMQPSSPNIPQ